MAKKQITVTFPNQHYPENMELVRVTFDDSLANVVVDPDVTAKALAGGAPITSQAVISV